MLLQRCGIVRAVFTFSGLIVWHRAYGKDVTTPGECRVCRSASVGRGAAASVARSLLRTKRQALPMRSLDTLTERTDNKVQAQVFTSHGTRWEAVMHAFVFIVNLL